MFKRWLGDRDRAGQRASGGIGLFVDGPNVLREPFDTDLHQVREVVSRRGRLRLARLYLDHRASTGLIQAGEAAGYEIHITSGDVDVTLAVDATSAIERDELDGIAIATRDIDFKPVIELARRRGLQTIVVAPGEVGRSTGLTAVADESILLEG